MEVLPAFTCTQMRKYSGTEKDFVLVNYTNLWGKKKCKWR